MNEALLTRVKTKLFLRARRPVTHLLDGQYQALQRGRSMDFDDLREYTPGDEVADIDWNATARTGTTLVRRWAAERRARVCLVCDSGRNMAARAASGEPKRDIAVMVAGTLGYLAVRHGDEVGFITGNAAQVTQLPFRATERALEAGLHAAHDHTILDGPASALPLLLERARTSLKQRMFVVVIADEIALNRELEHAVTALTAAHELVWVEIGDANPLQPGSFEVAGDWQLAGPLRASKRLRAEFAQARAERAARLRHLLERRGVSHTRISSQDAVVSSLLAMLKGRMHRARR